MLNILEWSCCGVEQAMKGMRNPLNSWARQDTVGNAIGEKDYSLAMQLSYAGPVHAKFRRMMIVYVTINAPLYWWKEFDTYKVGTVANSCSTMHKIQAKEFEPADFSTDHLTEESMACVNTYIAFLNENRKRFLGYEQRLKTDDSLTQSERKHKVQQQKQAWWQMIQLLPSSYNQKRTVMLNYEVLANIYASRRNHKLDEWHVVCDWIKKLPYSNIITLEN